MRQAFRESLLCAPPEYEVGARVTVAFKDHVKRFAGTVNSCRVQPAGRPLYGVEFDDGDIHDDLHESEPKPGPEKPGTEAHVVVATRPSDNRIESVREQLRKEGERLQKQPLPRPHLPNDLHPGCPSHCGGDLCFPNLTLAQEAVDGGRFRMPLFTTPVLKISVRP